MNFFISTKLVSYFIRLMGELAKHGMKFRRLSPRNLYATGRKYIPNFVSAIKLEAIVSDSMAKPIVDGIMATLSTGSVQMVDL